MGSLEGMPSVHFSEFHELGLAELIAMTRFISLAADRLVTISYPLCPTTGPAKETELLGKAGVGSKH